MRQARINGRFVWLWLDVDGIDGWFHSGVVWEIDDDSGVVAKR
jgi:hypothetical protein